MNRSNIVLIGMPGAGKSTVGVILAKLTGREFIDTDILIQTSTHRTLQDIIDKDGHLALRKVEEEIILGLSLVNHIIATGGSAAYSEPAMTHLKSHGQIIFLDVELTALEARIHNFATRGLARRPDQTFADLFHERYSLYTKYADLTVQCGNLSQEEVCERIIHSRDTGKIPT